MSGVFPGQAVCRRTLGLIFKCSPEGVNDLVNKSLFCNIKHRCLHRYLKSVAILAQDSIPGVLTFGCTPIHRVGDVALGLALGGSWGIFAIWFEPLANFHLALLIPTPVGLCPSQAVWQHLNLFSATLAACSSFWSCASVALSFYNAEGI